MVSVKITGITTTNQFLKSTSKEVFNTANKAIKDSGFFIEGEVKQSIAGHRAEPTSVDTGQFLNSITNAQKAPLTATVESNVPQAAFMEYGTSRIIPRRHFNNTAKRNQNKVRDFVQSKIKSAI